MLEKVCVGGRGERQGASRTLSAYLYIYSTSRAQRKYICITLHTIAVSTSQGGCACLTIVDAQILYILGKVGAEADKRACWPRGHSTFTLRMRG